MHTQSKRCSPLDLPPLADHLVYKDRCIVNIDQRLVELATNRFNLGREKKWVFWDRVIRYGLLVMAYEQAQAPTITESVESYISAIEVATSATAAAKN